MQTFNILQSKSKIDSSPQILLVCLELQLFLITEFATFTEPEIYFFRSGKRITITKFSFFAGNPFKNKHALFG